MPLLATSRAIPSSSTCRWASARSPQTTTSPSEILLSEAAGSIEWTQTRPSITRSSPLSCSAPSTSAILATVVGASTRVEVVRDSRM